MLRIGATKIAVKQRKSEILKDFIGGVAVVQHLAQIAPDRAPIALQQLPPGGFRRLVRAPVCAHDDRPEGRDATDAWVDIFDLHRPSSSRLRRNSRYATDTAVQQKTPPVRDRGAALANLVARLGRLSTIS